MGLPLRFVDGVANRLSSFLLTLGLCLSFEEFSFFFPPFLFRFSRCPNCLRDVPNLPLISYLDFSWLFRPAPCMIQRAFLGALPSLPLLSPILGPVDDPATINSCPPPFEQPASSDMPDFLPVSALGL